MKECRTETGAPLERVPLAERFDAMLARFEEKRRRTLRRPGFANYPPRTSVEVEIAIDFQPQLRKFHNGLFVEMKAWIRFAKVSNCLH